VKSTVSSVWLYVLPLLPLLPRCWIAWRFRAFMSEELSVNERAATEHRTVILALAGFSFSAALALPAYGASTQADVLLPTFYVVVSFLCYMGALNSQTHKFSRWHDQFGSALADIATLSLILAVLGMVAALQPPWEYFLVIVALSAFVWGGDTILRFSSWCSFFHGKESYDIKETNSRGPGEA
jgi:hypothetical protein